jgi:hypothetical protein
MYLLREIRMNQRNDHEAFSSIVALRRGLKTLSTLSSPENARRAL